MTLTRTSRLAMFAVLLAGCAPVASYTAAPGGNASQATVVACSYAAQPAPEKQKADEPENKEEAVTPKKKITLPLAIEMCVHNNFRVLAAAQGIHIAEGDFVTSSLIPNPSLFADCQLIPLQETNIRNQLGPPQWDTLVAVPIDWLLFGKRVAAMQTAQLGIETSRADFEDVLRLQVSKTVDAFYEVLMDEAYLKVVEKNLAELTTVQRLTVEFVKVKKGCDLEVHRSKLAVQEAMLQKHDVELAVAVAKAKLRPLIGCTAADPDFEVEGSLAVTTVVPPPKLEEAVALAEAHRPDLESGRKAVEQAQAAEKLECRKAWPVVAIQPGWSYYDQRHMNGQRNGSMLDIGISATLPFTDRNQGNIRKAQAQVAQRQLTYEGNRADTLADVEAGVVNYAEAVENLKQANAPETVEAARDLGTCLEVASRGGDHKVFELLDAQKARNNQQAQLIKSQADYWRALNKLNEVVGLRVYNTDKEPAQPCCKEADRNR